MIAALIIFAIGYVVIGLFITGYCAAQMCERRLPGHLTEMAILTAFWPVTLGMMVHDWRGEKRLGAVKCENDFIKAGVAEVERREQEAKGKL